MKKILTGNILALIGIATLTPLSLALAQNGLRTVDDVSRKFIDLGNMFLQVLIAFSIIWIVFNVVRYLIVGADNEDSRKTAQQAIMWGIIGLAIILSIWGIVNVVIRTFRFNDNNAPVQNFPRIPTRTGGSGSSSSGTGGTSGSGTNIGLPSRPTMPDTGINP